MCDIYKVAKAIRGNCQIITVPGQIHCHPYCSATRATLVLEKYTSSTRKDPAPFPVSHFVCVCECECMCVCVCVCVHVCTSCTFQLKWHRDEYHFIHILPINQWLHFNHTDVFYLQLQHTFCWPVSISNRDPRLFWSIAVSWPHSGVTIHLYLVLQIIRVCGPFLSFFFFSISKGPDFLTLITR